MTTRWRLWSHSGNHARGMWSFAVEHRVPRVHAASGALGSTRWTCHVCAVDSERSCGFPRREEEQRKKEDTTDFLRNCLDHQMDTLHKHSISRVLVRSRCVESGQKTTLFHKLVQSVFTEGSFRIMDTLLGFVLFLILIRYTMASSLQWAH